MSPTVAKRNVYALVALNILLLGLWAQGMVPSAVPAGVHWATGLVFVAVVRRAEGVAHPELRAWWTFAVAVGGLMD
jgi:hypothetical protein